MAWLGDVFDEALKKAIKNVEGKVKAGQSYSILERARDTVSGIVRDAHTMSYADNPDYDQVAERFCQAADTLCCRIKPHHQFNAEEGTHALYVVTAFHQLAARLEGLSDTRQAQVDGTCDRLIHDVILGVRERSRGQALTQYNGAVGRSSKIGQEIYTRAQAVVEGHKSAPLDQCDL